MPYWKNKVVVITGSSAGFGKELAVAFVKAQAKVALVARDEKRLTKVQQELGEQTVAFPADVTSDEEVQRIRDQVVEQMGCVDVLVNCVGKSARGAVLDTSPEEFKELFCFNFLTTVRCTRVFMSALKESSGHVINVGSLATKSASRYLGAYPASKFPLAAYSQQLRLELSDDGSSVHVLLVCPGPIARSDAGSRYDDMAGVPEVARQPGGGVKIKGIDPQLLAGKILSACERRQIELVVPAKARMLFILSQLSARLGDWLVSKMTR